jgi:hypothetical protein
VISLLILEQNLYYVVLNIPAALQKMKEKEKVSSGSSTGSVSQARAP